jgi:hypothetical protein
MDKCPTEIHVEIARFACKLDDGNTARALSHTSSHFRVVSSQFRFRCLSVSGVAQLESVLALLAAADAKADVEPHSPRPIIEHLFICDRPRETACQDWQKHLRMSGQNGEVEEARRKFAALDADAHFFMLALPKLLQRAMPTVQTMTILAYDLYRAPVIIQAILRTRWPQLEELTLRGSAWEADPPTPIGVDQVLFPRLERVHLAATRMYQRILRQINAAASGPVVPIDAASIENGTVANTPTNTIKHIRLSGLSRTPDLAIRIHAELSAKNRVTKILPALDRPGYADFEAPALEWKPMINAGQLQTLVVNPLPLPSLVDCACCSGYADSEVMQYVFRQLARSSKDNCVVYVRPTKFHEAYPYEQARRDWVSRITGKDGCWVTESTYEGDVSGDDKGNPIHWEGTNRITGA